METKLVRISTVAEGIALQYSSSVSKGIIEMHSRMGKPMVNVPSVTAQTASRFSSTPVPESGVPVMFNAAYWTKLGDVVKSSVESMVGKGY